MRGNIIQQSIKSLYDVKIVVKSADEIVNNSAVLQNDDELKLAVEANSVYHFFIFMRWTKEATAAQGGRYKFTIPAGGSLLKANTAGSIGSSTEVDGTIEVTGVNLNAGVIIRYGFHFLYIGGANSGTIQFQWAQDNAEAKDHTVKANSYIFAIRIK